MKILRRSFTYGGLLFLALTTHAIKSEMALDESFGTGGIIRSELIGPTSTAVMQSDGKILLTGNGKLIRYHSNGTLDTTFGVNGMVKTDLLNNFHFQSQLQPDHEIIVYGLVDQSTNFRLMRYKRDGSRDAAFTSPISTRALNQCPLALQPHDQKILVSGTTFDRIATLTRYNSNGSLDTTFGLDGTGTISIENAGAPSSITVDPESHTIIVSATAGFSHSFLSRYNSDGTLDTTFGPDTTGTIQVQGSITSTALQPHDHMIIVNGTPPQGNGSFIARYDLNGNLDVTFGFNGIITSPDRFFSITLQPDDHKIIVSKSLRGEENIFENHFLTRYNTNGTLDATFGPDGATLDVDFLDSINSVLLQHHDHKMIIAGKQRGEEALSLVRYRLLSPEEIELRRLATLAAQEAQRLAALASQEAARLAAYVTAEINDLMRTQLLEQCAICQEEDTLQSLIETECEHLFHPGCITSWINSGQAAARLCPVCRQALGDQQ